MSAMPPSSDTATGADPASTQPSPLGKDFLFDYRQYDLSAVLADRREIERWIPHRGTMAMLDEVIYVNEDGSIGIARKRIRPDEFWVPGHFPSKPVFPGVLQIETGAQLACFMFVLRKSGPRTPAFLRIENAAFRVAVVPGDELFLLCREFRSQKRRFISDVQGVVRDRVAFEARLSGMIVDPT
jgi:3-hydroxyacyl-[acyl-carrier-protein] dehydratase